MTATPKDLYIDQGATFVLSFQWCGPGTVDANGVLQPGPPKDLTGWTVRMQIRKTQGQPALADASTTNGKITLGAQWGDATTDPDLGGTPAPTNGWIKVKLTDADTDAITSKSAKYDLEAEDTNGNVYRLLQGNVTVDPNITQTGTDPVVT